VTELVFLDTECTGLDLDADIWEFAAVRRRTDGSRSQLHLFIAHDSAKALRLPEPFRTDYATRCPTEVADLVPQREAAIRIAEYIGINAVVIGAVAAFDSQRLAVLFARHRMAPPRWLYTVVDVCALAAGYLRAQGQSVQFPVHVERVSRRLGIDADQYARHTALGDVTFVEAIFDRCMEPVESPSSALAHSSPHAPEFFSRRGQVDFEDRPTQTAQAA
jgi:DNA polymerase III epsilon subunit-like protein